MPLAEDEGERLGILKSLEYSMLYNKYYYNNEKYLRILYQYYQSEFGDLFQNPEYRAYTDLLEKKMFKMELYLLRHNLAKKVIS